MDFELRYVLHIICYMLAVDYCYFRGNKRISQEIFSQKIAYAFCSLRLIVSTENHNLKL